MGRRDFLIPTVLLLCLSASAWGVATRPQGQSGGHPAPIPTDRLVRFFADSLGTDDPQRASEAILGLRELDDEHLRPLFAQLGASDERSVRAQAFRHHAILAMAELNEPAGVDLLLVKKIEKVDEQGELLAAALEESLLSENDIRDIVRWRGIDPTMRVLLLGKLRDLGVFVEPDEFRESLLEARLATRLYAALQLIDIGFATPEEERVLDELFALEGPTRNEALEIIIELIRSWRLTSARGLVQRALASPRTPPLLRFECIWTLLVIAPDAPESAAIWLDEFSTADAASRTRLGLAMLHATLANPGRVPDRLFNVLTGADDPLLELMASAGQALNAESRDPTPFARLVAQAHPPSVLWSLDVAASIGGPLGDAIRAQVIRTALDRGGGEPRLYDAATLASERVSADGVPEVGAILADAVARGQSRCVEAILAGALRCDAPNIGDLAPSGRDWPSRRAAAMATLLAARSSESLGEDLYEDLAGIALAEDLLRLRFRMQACWLALRCKGQSRTALAQALAGTPR